MEIFGAEKSFIVIAATQAVQMDWIQKINQAREAMGLGAGAGGGAAEVTTAPLWIPDHGSDRCFICKLVRARMGLHIYSNLLITTNYSSLFIDHYSLFIFFDISFFINHHFIHRSLLVNYYSSVTITQF